MWKAEQSLTVLFRAASSSDLTSANFSAPEARKKEAMLKEMVYKYDSMQLKTMSGEWVTPTVFDISFHIEVTLKEPVDGELVKNIKNAVVLGFVAEKNTKTPAVFKQKKNIGKDYYDFDETTQNFNLTNELIIDLENKMDVIVKNGVKMFNKALDSKFPNLKLVQIELPAGKEFGYMVRDE